MQLAEYRKRYAEDSSPGWDALNAQLDDVYRGQEPKHWGTLIKQMLGGPDPIDGISAYSCQREGTPHLHFCTFGYSSLYYDEKAVGGDYSRFGFEMTFRLAADLPLKDDPLWVCNLLQNLARYVFETGNQFARGHWIPANGPINADLDTELVGLAFVGDPVLQPVDTPHGLVEYVQAFGINQQELDALMSKEKTCEQVVEPHRIANPLLITDLNRRA